MDRRWLLAFAVSFPLMLVACSDDAAPATPEGGAIELPWMGGETWFLVGGPHCDSPGGDCGEQSRYALDFAPVAPMSGNACRPGRLDPYWVTAAGGGTVRVASRSLVEIDHENGKRSGYYHLLTASLQVAVGEHVEAGDRLGHPSCEHLRGGGSRGAHVHFYLCDVGSGPEGCLGDANFVLPADGMLLSGWRVTESGANYEGTIEQGNELRVALNLRCDGSEGASADCGANRNELFAR